MESGAFELGFERAGIETVLQAERDPWALEVLARHWPGMERVTDVRDVSPDTAYNASMKKQPLIKLTEDKLAEAIRRYDAGESLAPIAKDMGVSRQSMWDVLRRRTVMRPQKRYGDENHFYRGGSFAEDQAHNKVEKAVKSGRMARPDDCGRCGGCGVPFKDGRHPIQAHHDDYTKPLDVRWLCQPCHHEHHKGKEVPAEAPSIDLIYGGFP